MSAHRGQGYQVPLELELQVSMSIPMWVLGTKLGYFARAPSKVFSQTGYCKITIKS